MAIYIVENIECSESNWPTSNFGFRASANQFHDTPIWESCFNQAIILRRKQSNLIQSLGVKMNELVGLTRLLLASILAVAAITKSIGFSRSVAGMSNFGVPIQLRTPATVAVIAGELVVSVGLFSEKYLVASSIAAVAMFSIFTVLMARAYLSGIIESCGCFGNFHDTKIGKPSILRNLVLLVVAVLIAVYASIRQPEAILSIYSRSLGLSQIGVLLVLISVVGAVIALSVSYVLVTKIEELKHMLENAGIHAMQALEPGLRIPNLELRSYFDSSEQNLYSLMESTVSKSRTLILVSPTCSYCHEILELLASRSSSNVTAIAPAIIVVGPDGLAIQGDQPAFHNVLSEFREVYVDLDQSVLTQLRINALPSVAILGLQGELLEPIATGSTTVMEILGLT